MFTVQHMLKEAGLEAGGPNSPVRPRTQSQKLRTHVHQLWKIVGPKDNSTINTYMYVLSNRNIGIKGACLARACLQNDKPSTFSWWITTLVPREALGDWLRVSFVMLPPFGTVNSQMKGKNSDPQNTGGLIGPFLIVLIAFGTLS